MLKALVTGSGGLVGSEAVLFLLDKGFKVYGIDNDTRKYLFGEEASTWEQTQKLEDLPNFFNINSDIRDNEKVKQVFKDYGPFDFIIHAAAQPAHEWSTNHALEDFSINATGTMIMLENYRHYSPEAVFIQVSSSKVYGDSVNNLPLVELEKRYDLPKDHPMYEGVGEEMRIDGALHSLFGASKACGDIMAQEYGKYFNLPIAIVRPVCITGKFHRGAELHGYLAYLVKCVATSTPYTINGYKGKQVRDNIHAYDLVAAFYEIYKDPSGSYGEVYNVGAGRESNNSILEAIQQVQMITGKRGEIHYSEVNRRGDHRWCIYSSSKFRTKYPDWKITYDNDRIMNELCKLYE